MKRREDVIPNGRRLTQTPYDFLGAISAGLLVVFFCFILLWHDPLVFWNDDYELSVLPVFADMARSWSEGHWPILSPYSWVCGNLAGEFQYRSVFGFCERSCHRHLEISAHVFAASGCRFHCASFRSGSRRIFARARSSVFSSLVDFRRADCIVKRLDHLLGRDGLVRRVRRLYMAALGVVGGHARSRSTAKQMEISLAGAVCLPPRYWRISLHGFDALPLDLMAGDQGISGNSEHFVGCADAFWRGTRLRLVCSRVARASRFGSGFSARVAAGESALAMACSTSGFARPDLAMLDR